MKILFWLSILPTIYTYFLYPLILIFLTKISPSRNKSNRTLKRNPKTEYFPRVSLVIAAYNEEEIIEEKIQNSLALTYPKEKLEVIIASDGSEDRTNEIVSSYESSGIELIDYPRTGKIGVINRTIPQTQGDIIVLSDANTMYSPDAINRLVRHFDNNSKIGVVCGKLQLSSQNGHNKEGLYWRYEVALRSMEGKMGSTLGANGAIYALRKELFEPLPDSTIADDFVIAMRIKEKGYDVIFEPEAKAYEESQQDVTGEFVRRTRVAAAGFQAISLTKGLLNPKKGFAAFAYWSHKIIRWHVPFFLVLAFIVNIFLLHYTTYQILFALQILFYLGAFVGYLLSKTSHNFKLFSIPYYFTAMNLALFVGFFRFLTKIQKAAWESRVR